MPLSVFGATVLAFNYPTIQYVSY